MKTRFRCPLVLALAACFLLLRGAAWSQLVISEVMAKNVYGGLQDEDGSHPDWIELHNTGATGVDLGGHYLTDTDTLLQKWPLPAVTIDPGGFLIVFASDKDRDSGQLHTNFQLDADGEAIGLVNAQGAVLHWIDFPVQTALISYGLREMLVGELPTFLASPTPGLPNPPTAAALSEAPIISPAGRTFTTPFVVTIAGHTPGAEIRYTLDGSVPHAASQLLSPPLIITTSSRLRCREYVNGQPVSKLAGETYLPLAADVQNFTSNLPLVILDNFQTGRPTNGTLAEAQIFTPQGPNARTSLTQLPNLRSRALIRVRGSSTSTDLKPSLALEFRDELDVDRSLAPLGFSAASDWVMNAPYTYDRSLLRNALVYELSNAMGQYAVRTQQVEVYLNTDGGPISAADYAGVYTFMEKIERGEDRVDIEKLSPGQDSPAKLPGGYMIKLDRPDPGDTGFVAAGNQRFYHVEPKEDEISIAQANWIGNYMNSLWTSLNSVQFRDPVGGYGSFLDVPAAIDHHLLNVAVKNVDGLRVSTYLSKGRFGKLKFGPVWDFDRSIDSIDGRDNNFDTWRGETGDLGTDFFRAPIWGELFRDSNFWQRWIDRFAELRRGPLADANINQIVDSMAAELAEAAPRNFARWPAVPPRTSWAWEVAHLKTWLASRLAWMEGQFLPAVVANTAQPSGGQVPAGFLLSLNPSVPPPPSAQIYYTTDGTDPRIPETATAWDHTLVTDTAAVRVLVPTADLGPNWYTNPLFDDSSWLTGTKSMGYDDETVFDPYIGVQLEAPTASMKNVMGSAYLRTTFTLTPATLAALGKLELRVRYDDAFVAWINGTQVATGGSVPSALAWNSQATAGNPDSEAVNYRVFDISGSLDKLLPGENVLAIQGLNYLLTSSDFLIQPQLFAATKVSSLAPQALLYTGPIVVPGATTITARYLLPGLPHTPWPYTGSGSGQKPVGSVWGAPAQLHLYTDTTAPLPGQLELAEIMPRPAEATAAEEFAGFGRRSSFEYITLKNVSPTAILDLTGVNITGSTKATILAGPSTRLLPGEIVILARDTEAFVSRYGSSHNQVANLLRDMPDAAGSVTLKNAAGTTLDTFAYGDASTRSELDEGHSLVRIPPNLRPSPPQAGWRLSLDPLGELPGSAPQSFADWQTRHFPAYLPNSEIDSAPTADPDADGIDNWTEYALATQPRQPNALPMHVTHTPQGPMLHLERRAALTDANMHALASAGLANWQLLATLPTNGTPTASGKESVSILLPQTPNRQFYRIEITD